MTFHQAISDGNGWTTLQQTPLFTNPYVEIYGVEMSSPTRPHGFKWTVCHRKAGVVVSARTTDGQWVLIRQERVPLKTDLWEFPAGQIDTENHHSEEIIIQTGIRELAEESGFQPSDASHIFLLGKFFSSPGFTDEHCHMLFIDHVIPLASGPRPDAAEAIVSVQTFTGQQIKTMVRENILRDANSLCSIARLTVEGLL
jgi:8-oxo-dGTP pyrophosphatase MutT (NUDIX family)